MNAKPIHSMIRVADEARSVAFYKTAFGLEVAERFPLDGFTLVYLRNETSPFELELTVNEGRDKPYDLGDGYGHIAMLVEDLTAAHARMAADGLDPGPLRELDLGGRPARFFFVKDPDGYAIEVLGPGGRFG